MKLAEQVELLTAWMKERTGLNPHRLQYVLLDMMVWLEGEMDAQVEHSKAAGVHSDYRRTWAECLDATRAIARPGPAWHMATWHVENGARRDPTPEEARAHRIGRAQARGETNPQFWYAIPPRPLDPGDQLAV